MTEVFLMNLSKKTCKQDKYKSEQLNGSGDFRNVKNQTFSPVDNMNLMSSFKQPRHINDKTKYFTKPQSDVPNAKPESNSLLYS